MNIISQDTMSTKAKNGWKKRGLKRQFQFKTNRSIVKSGISPYSSFARINKAVDSKHFPITMAENVICTWFPTNGLNNGGFNGITFGIVQSGIIYSIGTGAWNVLQFANFGSLANVFEEYRILKFEIDWYASTGSLGYSSAAVTANTSANVSMPMVYMVEDREDAISLTNIQQACQYSSMTTGLAGAQMANGGMHKKVMNKPSIVVAADNDASLIGTLTAAKLERSPWMSCGSNAAAGTAPLIPHGFLKFYVDANGNTSAATQFQFNFIVRAFFEYRGID